MKQLHIVRLVAAGALLVSCGKPVVKQHETLQQGHDIVRTEKGDTVGYVISFHDSTDRRRFSSSFEKLVKEYPFRRDSLVQNRFFRLELASAAKPIAPETKPAAAETLVQKEQAPGQKPAEKIKPRYGGTVAVYSQRAFVDRNVSSLAECYPFENDACLLTHDRETAGYFQVKDVSDRTITLVLTDKAITAAGKRLTSFDLVNAWTAYVKTHPAEGSAVFHNVQGLGGFVRGREAIIGGFQVTDDKTILLRFDPPDPHALARMCTPRIMPASLKMGPYWAKSDNGGAVVFVANPHFPGTKAYLTSCTVKLGKDANPILSYSLNRYDMVSLFSAKDLDYVRRKAPDQSTLAVFSEDRYFLSCSIDNAAVRQAIRNSLNPRDILTNFVKAEGTVLSAIETDNAPAIAPVPGDKGQSVSVPPVPVLYRSEDPASAIIAEKIVADLTRSGLACSLKPATQEEYEVMLVRRDYGLAVGWAPSSVLFDESEKLRLAAMWFGGADDERGRISENREMPLFSVKEYLLCRKKVAFAGDVLEGLFVAE